METNEPIYIDAIYTKAVSAEEAACRRQMNNMKRTCVAAGWVMLGAMLAAMAAAVILPVLLPNGGKWCAWGCMLLEAASFGAYQLLGWIVRDVIGRGR